MLAFAMLLWTFKSWLGNMDRSIVLQCIEHILVNKGILAN